MTAEHRNNFTDDTTHEVSSSDVF
ncbi:unnamed protein product, partial [Rotaria magnacalcarata]